MRQCIGVNQLFVSLEATFEDVVSTVNESNR